MADRRYDIVKWQDNIPVPRWLLPTLDTVDIITDSNWGPDNKYNIEYKPESSQHQELFGAYEALREGLPKITWSSGAYDVWAEVDKKLDSKYKDSEGEAYSIFYALTRAAYSNCIGTNLLYERVFWDMGKDPPAISLVLLAGHDLALSNVKNGKVSLPSGGSSSGSSAPMLWGAAGLAAGYLLGCKK